MYRFRDYSLNYDKLYIEQPQFRDILKSAAFEFTGKDIAKLRKNMGTLLDKLLILYLATLSENESTEPIRYCAN
jgi:hypothetical protein